MNAQSQQFYWTGTYSFVPEMKFFLESVKKQIDFILNKIDKSEELIERK